METAFISLPLEIKSNGFAREKQLKQSIDEMLRLLISVPKGGAAADPDFGFVFNNFTFENFNESDGTVYNSQSDIVEDENRTLYSKKISGSSKSLNTFAAELRAAINIYEPRLADVTTSMTYIREERNIYIMVKGIIRETKEDYQYSTVLKIWN